MARLSKDDRIAAANVLRRFAAALPMRATLLAWLDGYATALERGAGKPRK
jgi:hypothetical protein